MKTPTSIPSAIVALLSLGLACLAHAEDALLNSNSLVLQTSAANLIRSSLTPAEVKVAVPIPMPHTVCMETGQEARSGESALHCGSDRLVQAVCRDIPQPRGDACRPIRECQNEVIDVPRYCTWFETVCVRSEIHETIQLKTVTLKLKKAPKLATGETEVYKLSATAKRTDSDGAIFNLQAVSTKRAVSIDAKDGLFSGFKDVITVKAK